MALPANINYGTVSGVFLRAKADGVDVDRNPDGDPIRGLKVTFTPSISPALVKNTTAVPPVTILIDPVVCTTDDDGVLCGPDGSPDVLLVASGDTDLDPSGWTWTVEIKQTSTFPRVSFAFVVGVDSVTDLSTVLPVPAGLGADLILWQQAVADTLAAKVAAQAAQAAAEAVPTTTDGLMTTIDANAASAYRVQADARQNATIDGKVSDSEAAEVARLGGTFSRRRGNRVGTALDSISNQGAGIESGFNLNYSRGYYQWANVTLGSRMTQVYASSAWGDEWGTSGLTAATFVSSGEADLMAAADLDIAIILGGVNDMLAGGLSAAATIGYLTSIWDKLIAGGKIAVACTLLPPGPDYASVAGSTGLPAKIRQLNDLIRTAASTRRGVVLCDWHHVLLDPATGLAKAGYLYDAQLHPSATGAARLGAYLATVLDPLTYKIERPGRVNADVTNLLTNPLMTGSGGTIPGAFGTGTVAAGGTITRQGVSTGTASLVAKAGLTPGNWQQITLVCPDDGADGIQYDMRNSNIGTDYVVGDTVRGTVEYEIDAGHNVRALFGYMRVQPSGYAQALQFTTPDRTTAPEPLWLPLTGVIHTPPIVVVTGTTRVQVDLFVYGDCTIRFGGFKIEKV